MSSPEPLMDIDYVANLARISLTDEERGRYGQQLAKILGFFEMLREVDVEGVEPSAHAFELENVWQEDVAQPGLAPEAALANAPSQRDRQVVVPKVVDDA